MKSLFRCLSLQVHAHFHFSISSPICYPSDWRSNYNFLSSLAPVLFNKCHGLWLRWALIFQLPWVNRDEQAIALKLLNHLIWSWAKFQKLRHKYQPGHWLWKLQELGERQSLFSQRAISTGTSLPPKWLHIPKKTRFPACQCEALICFHSELVPISLFQSPLAGWKFI